MVAPDSCLQCELVLQPSHAACNRQPHATVLMYMQTMSFAQAHRPSCEVTGAKSFCQYLVVLCQERGVVAWSPQVWKRRVLLESSGKEKPWYNAHLAIMAVSFHSALMLCLSVAANMFSQVLICLQVWFAPAACSFGTD